MKTPFTGGGQKGFSLVELMIVVGIIGILATLALPRFQQFQAKAKMGEAKNLLTHIYTLEQSFHLDNNNYVGFNTYGRLGNGGVNCDNPPAGAMQIGFQIAPCTDANAPVPRFGYDVNRQSRSAFLATARTGNGDNNLVCPGSGVVTFDINHNKRMQEMGAANGSALTTCFRNDN